MSERGRTVKPAVRDARKRTGASGEAAAARHLERLGYKALHRNWRCRTGEIDIVAEDGDTLVFVEVRTRRRIGTFGTPLESVDARKIRQVRDTALAYLHLNGKHGSAVRFDVIAVTLGDNGEAAELRHVKMAF